MIMKKYRNTVTGQIISVATNLTGGHWEPVEKKKPAEKKPVATTRKEK